MKHLGLKLEDGRLVRILRCELDSAYICVVDVEAVLAIRSKELYLREREIQYNK